MQSNQGFNSLKLVALANVNVNGQVLYTYYPNPLQRDEQLALTLSSIAHVVEHAGRDGLGR